MIAVDTSAIVAIIFDEDEAEVFDRKIAGQSALVGAPTLLEAHQVIAGRAEMELQPIERFVLRPTIRIIPFDFAHFRVAVLAFTRFGKGRGHPAQLNFGDCMAYAVAKVHDAPLLYKGSDFAHTDIRAALP